MNAGDIEAGEARRLAEGQALLAIKCGGQRAPYALFGKQRIVVEMEQDRFGPLPVQNP